MYQINDIGGANPSSLRIVGPEHVSDGVKALAFEFQIRSPAPSNYAGFERYLETPQDWSAYTQLCMWIDNQSTATDFIIQFREQGDEGWKHQSSLATIDTDDYCWPLSKPAFALAEWSSPVNGRIDLGAIVYFGIYINGPVRSQGVIYFDNIRVTNQSP